MMARAFRSSALCSMGTLIGGICLRIPEKGSKSAEKSGESVAIQLAFLSTIMAVTASLRTGVALSVMVLSWLEKEATSAAMRSASLCWGGDGG